jgi:hypothetical protein
LKRALKNTLGDGQSSLLVVSDKEFGDWLLFMKPVQLIGGPTVPGGMRVDENMLKPCLPSCEKVRKCTWRFDGFGESIDVFGILDWHVAIPSKWSTKCKEVGKRSSTAVEFLDAQDYCDRGIHRVSQRTAWTTEAFESLSSLCQESGVAYFQKFLKGTS